jgi:predicted Rossmann-fold nucleotide-binding protein
VVILQVVSGGQTGVDRAALDAALERGFACGGWCPRGRLAEDGPIAPRYPVRELPEGGYAVRTVRTVRDSDGTLILLCGGADRGTQLTRRTAQSEG